MLDGHACSDEDRRVPRSILGSERTTLECCTAPLLYFDPFRLGRRLQGYNRQAVSAEVMYA
jgi:hypothetical protein